ncbi:MAG TPA: polysaccharide biosynthesis/export family protein [Gemmatimonadales bacterium]|jgi:polysaccharide export outer membrane protein
MRPLLALALGTAFLTAPARAQQTTPPVTANAGASYHLSPGDILKVSVFGHEEFSGQFQVDENGKISFPAIGDIDTRNITVADVREKLRQGLSGLFNQAFVSVTPLFRIAVLGDVMRPGLYTADPTLSIIDVIALAGGPSQNGNLNGIRLLRGGQQHVISFNGEQTQMGTLSSLGIRSGDQIFVPGKKFNAATLSLIVGVLQLGISIVVLVNTVK